MFASLRRLTFASIAATALGAFAQTPPAITDQQRLELNKQCVEKVGVNFVDMASFFVGLGTGDLGAVAAPFLQGATSGKGCDEFLTDEQIETRKLNAAKAKITSGEPVVPGMWIHTNTYPNDGNGR
jgi:hypothetical protein